MPEIFWEIEPEEILKIKQDPQFKLKVFYNLDILLRGYAILASITGGVETVINSATSLGDMHSIRDRIELLTYFVLPQDVGGFRKRPDHGQETFDYTLRWLNALKEYQSRVGWSFDDISYFPRDYQTILTHIELEEDKFPGAVLVATSAVHHTTVDQDNLNVLPHGDNMNPTYVGSALKRIREESID